MAQRGDAQRRWQRAGDSAILEAWNWQWAAVLITERWQKMGRSVHFCASGEETVQAVAAALKRRGMRLERSFDLQTARARHPEECLCPGHGAGQCTCQYVVALAYPAPQDGLLAVPQVLTARAYGQATLVTVHSDQGGSDNRYTVMAAVLEAAGELDSQGCAE
jgi:hypothetical protein